MAAFGIPRVAGANQRAVQGGGGAAGGGTVTLSNGTLATLSVFATRLTDADGNTVLLVGNVVIYARGHVYVSRQVTNYGPIPGNENGREIDGLMAIDGAGNHPFHISMPDLALGGIGTDTVGFQIWDASPGGTPLFSFQSVLTSGDIRLLVFGNS
jgi:hypothetical protein